jgi:RecA-family ATPase
MSSLPTRRQELQPDPFCRAARGITRAHRRHAKQRASTTRQQGNADGDKQDETVERDEPGVLLSEVAPEEVQWLWHPRLPLGKLVLLEGDPDVGKTTVALDLAARVSRGAPMPGSTEEQSPRGVVVLSAEDGLADTVVPRLQAAGAYLVRIVSEPFGRLPSLDAVGLDRIRQLIGRVEACLVILDPMAAFIPDPIDTYRDHRVRRLLAPLMQLAEETDATILLLRHLTKVQAGMKRNPHYAGGGSIAFTAAARVVLHAAIDPQDSTCRVLARVKGNLAEAFPAFGYRLVPHASGVVTVEWLGETSHSAEELLGGGGTVCVDQGALEEAKVWLLAKLGEGPVWAREITYAAWKEDIAAPLSGRRQPSG